MLPGRSAARSLRKNLWTSKVQYHSHTAVEVALLPLTLPYKPLVEYGEFAHKPGEKFYDFHEVRAEARPSPRKTLWETHCAGFATSTG